MCSNFRAPTRDSIEEYFSTRAPETLKLEMYPKYEGPFIRRSREGAGRECVVGTFGLLPHWAKPDLARSTYNARSETVAEKASFRNAWNKAQHCIIPVDWIYEPNYEQGKPVRWKIQRRDARPFGIAGLWEWRPDKSEQPNPDGLFSFTMLTVNADDHPLMKRFHAPDDEKRMICILEPEQYDSWLGASVVESMAFMRQYPADALAAAPSPRPPRGAGEQQQAA
jgi:putative SOS response-associated peptidase YedK